MFTRRSTDVFTWTTYKHRSSTGPLILEDVHAAVQEIADGDSSKTNASAIRKHLKRGPSSTIKKHLDGLRIAKQSEITKELHTDLSRNIRN